jgi:hypothetical protein
VGRARQSRRHSLQRVRENVLKQTLDGTATYTRHETKALVDLPVGVEVVEVKTFDERIAEEVERRREGGEVDADDFLAREVAAENAFVPPKVVPQSVAPTVACAKAAPTSPTLTADGRTPDEVKAGREIAWSLDHDEKTLHGSMARGGIRDAYGRRLKRRTKTPQQDAAEAENAARVKRETQARLNLERKSAIDAVLEPLRGMARYSRLNVEVRSALRDYIVAAEAAAGLPETKFAPFTPPARPAPAPVSTKADPLGLDLTMTKAAREIASLPVVPDVETLVSMKLAKVVGTKAATEARIIDAMSDIVSAEGRPDGYSDELWAIEQAQNAVNRKFRNPIAG